MPKYAPTEGEDEVRAARQWDAAGLLEMVTRGEEGAAAGRKQAGQQLLMGRGGSTRWNRRLMLLVCVALVFVVATFCRHILPGQAGWAWYSEQQRHPPIRSSASYGLPSAVGESECPTGMACFHRARSVSPRDLLAGRYARWNATTSTNSNNSSSAIPRLLHQSWGQKSMPDRVSRWSNQCRMLNPDWQYVLWTDEDNRELVKQRYSWFLPTYDALQSNIKRADAVRNLYMHAFGGVYLDFDVECIRPFDVLFDLHSKKEEGGKTSKQAFLGRMGSDDHHAHSIPNDWMASSPGHPFFLLPISVISSTLQHDKVKPEDETGPVPLRTQLLRYQASLQGHQDYLDASLAALPVTFSNADSRATITVLDEHVIHPYSWTAGSRNRQGRACLGYLDTFDPDRCKELLQVQEKGTFAIAYWTHSWESVDQLNYR